MVNGDAKDAPADRAVTRPTPSSGFLGTSAAATAIRVAIQEACAVECPVLILGESGVGKELVAREIHASSRRARGPFVAVNCAAISPTLIESELFGHVAGAYTGAKALRRGAFEMADGGTLLLDEVGDLSPEAQPKLLRAIESGEIQRLGDERQCLVDNRVIAATHQDLFGRSRDGSFRADLYYRIDVLEIAIPPLRERPEDVEVLVAHFAQLIARKNEIPCPAFEAEAMRVLVEHEWPGNVRELRATLERAMAHNPGGNIDASCLLIRPIGHAGLTLRGMLRTTWDESRRAFETLYVDDLMRRHGNNVAAAARSAGLSRRGLYKMLRRLGEQKAGHNDRSHSSTELARRARPRAQVKP